MSTLRSIVRRVTPAPLRGAFWRAYVALLRVREHWRALDLAWSVSSSEAILSRHRLRGFRDRHRGERCFIIGNGPSLNNIDLSPLRNEITFGLNRIYLLFPSLGFSTTYYVSVNRLVIEQCAHEIEGLPMPKFISWHARGAIRFASDVIFVRDPCDGTVGFSRNPGSWIWEGTTVTYVAMQLAYYLGFHQVILIGVDHNFVTQGEPNTVVTSTGTDSNHFDPSYFGKAFRWQLPDLETSELAYRIAKYQFERASREIVDATIDGKLQVFRKVDYCQLFK